MNLYPCNAEISHYKIAEALLEEGVTMVQILTNRPGVELPSFLNTPIVNLNFSYRYGIDDFEVDERGIRASLSFKGVPHFCDIPWDAICAIRSDNTDQFFVWINVFNDEEVGRYLPPEIRAKFDEIKNESLLDEYPELKDFAFDEAKSEDEQEDEDDDVPPGGFTPLRFV